MFYAIFQKFGRLCYEKISSRNGISSTGMEKLKIKVKVFIGRVEVFHSKFYPPKWQNGQELNYTEMIVTKSELS